MQGYDEASRNRVDMFEDTNGVVFPKDIREEDKAWWLGVYDRFGLTPEAIGDRLSRSWSGTSNIKILQLDGEAQRLVINVQGEFGLGRFWIVNGTLDLVGTFLSADRIFVDDASQQGGIGRRFMRDAVELALEMGLQRIVLEADNVGRYAWLRCGFVPDRPSWGRMKRELLHRIAESQVDLEPDQFLALVAKARNERPETARELAADRTPVQSRYLLDPNGLPTYVPLGRALFIEASPPWAGSLDLNDGISLNMLRDYVGEP